MGNKLDLWRAAPLANEEDEFPHRDSIGTINRREVLKIMGASLALAGLAGCRSAFMPARHLIPYVEQPEDQPPGEFVYLRTTTVRYGYGFGLHVATREGRPIKVEGSPDHIASLGSCDPISMAEMLEFYDPDRSRSVLWRDQLMEWDDVIDFMRDTLAKTKGAGVSILTGATSSPTLIRQMGLLQAAYPGLHWHQYEMLSRDSIHAGTQMAFGTPLEPIYRTGQAKTILFVDYDFNRSELGTYRFAREMMGARDMVGSRIYSVHTMPSYAAGFADHSRPMSPSGIRSMLLDLQAGSSNDPWTQAVLADLKANVGAALVMPGEYLPAEDHALICAINSGLNAPVGYLPPITHIGENLASLVADMDAGRVEMLLISGINPVYASPHDLGFKQALSRVASKISHGLRPDETSEECDWRLPSTHSFEHWSDTLAYDGSVSISQPLIDPLFDGRSLHEVVGSLLGDDRPSMEYVKDTWRARFSEGSLAAAQSAPATPPSASIIETQGKQSSAVTAGATGGTTQAFDDFWFECVRTGIVPGTALTPTNPKLSATFQRPSPLPNGFNVLIRPDAHLADGRWSNNGWLQELPKPITGIMWDNAIFLNERTAAAYKVENGDHLRVGSIEGPIWIVHGHADDCATVLLGFGRSIGTVAEGPGFNCYPLVFNQTPFVAVAPVEKAPGHTDIATVQPYNGFAGVDVIHEFNRDEAITKENLSEEPTLYNQTATQIANLGRPQWGMSIDLDRCIGCNACVAACQAENNIPVVGKTQVIVGRHMHWIRIDTYFSGPVQNPRTFFQPLPCMQCETAPCEPVCPVAATVHSHEGINQMIYNRCVGTRYCSNNCPYKVRRFNFLNYQLEQPNFQDKGLQLLTLMNNPDVTVRSRGVMEKCTYCVQRINRARIKAKEENRFIADGEVVPACAEACPTNTIIFGDIYDPDSQARKLRDDKRTYALLRDLNTRPRTTYLSKIRNPNPAIPEEASA